jgi:hypothetical protein
MLALLVLMAGFSGEAPSQHVIIESGMILIFDSHALSKDLDTRHCYNAVAAPPVLKRIKAIIAQGREPHLSAKTVKGFFEPVRTARASSDILAHAIYHREVVQDFCERPDLVVITSAK